MLTTVPLDGTAAQVCGRGLVRGRGLVSRGRGLVSRGRGLGPRHRCAVSFAFFWYKRTNTDAENGTDAPVSRTKADAGGKDGGGQLLWHRPLEIVCE
jgi:hypothetical protein